MRCTLDWANIRAAQPVRLVRAYPTVAAGRTSVGASRDARLHSCDAQSKPFSTARFAVLHAQHTRAFACRAAPMQGHGAAQDGQVCMPDN